jgi:hypothetical protein
MTDIVIRTLSKEEAHDLRMLKAQLDEPTWRALFLRLIKERKELKQKNDRQSKSVP